MNDIDDWYDEDDTGPFDFSEIDWEYEDEQRALRGTSECDGYCDPQCSWCLVAHSCPADCADGECPYDALAKAERLQERVSGIEC